MSHRWPCFGRTLGLVEEQLSKQRFSYPRGTGWKGDSQVALEGTGRRVGGRQGLGVGGSLGRHVQRHGGLTQESLFESFSDLRGDP